MNEWESLVDTNQKIEFLIDLMHRGEIDTAQQFMLDLEESEIITQDLRSKILLIKTKLLRMKSSFDDAMTLIDEVIEINGEKPNFLGDSYLEKANLLFAKGKIEEADFYITQVEKIERNSGESLWVKQEQIAGLLHTKGLIRLNQGDIRSATRHFERSAVIFENLGRKRAAAIAWNNIGIGYRKKGELQEALKYFLKAFERAKEVGKNRTIAYSLGNIAYNYYLKGDSQTAVIYVQNCLTLFEEFNDQIGIAKALELLIKVNLDLDEDVESDFLRLKSISKENENKFINLYYNYCKAVLCKRSNRTRDKAKAESLFLKIINGEILDKSITIDATKHLIELLIGELRAYGEQDVIHEIKSHLDYLYEISDREKMWSTFVETMILNSKLLFVEGDFELAEGMLEKAAGIAKIHEMYQYQNFIQIVKKEHPKQYSKMKMLVDSNGKFGERIDEIDLLNYLENTSKIVNPEDPILFLLLDCGGSIRYSKIFNSSIKVNEHMIGSFLSAINQFGSEALEGSIDRINQKEYTIALKEYESNLFCYIYRGYSSNDTDKLDLVVKEILAQTDIFERLTKSIGFMIEDNDKKISYLIESIILS